MKHEVITAKKEFEPITVTITLEDINELKGLWVRMNQAPVWDDNEPDARGADMSCGDLWRELDAILKQRGQDEK